MTIDCSGQCVTNDTLGVIIYIVLFGSIIIYMYMRWGKKNKRKRRTVTFDDDDDEDEIGNPVNENIQDADL